MKKIFALALGLLTAVGGFIDIGDVVFASQAGAQFGYSLLWALVVGVIGIMIYSEMSGRVAAVAKLTVFDIIRRDYPPKLSFLTLVVSLLLNCITCAAEIGGVALILQLLSRFPYQILILLVLIALVVIVRFLKFGAIERLFGYLGLGMITMIVIALKTTPDLAHMGQGLLPQHLGSDTLTYWYFAVGLIGATLMPYEIYFYSSGSIEERWTAKDLPMNRFNAYAGFGVGSLIVAGIIVASANLFQPAQISPDFIGTPALLGLMQFGQAGVLLLLLGLLFSIGGSAVETAFSGAYNLSQYAGWRWGKHLPTKEAPKFTRAWFVIMIMAAAIIMTGIDPVQLTEYAVIFSVVIMPLTFYPIFKAAGNKRIMKQHANGRFINALGWVYLILIIGVALAAVPLMFLTHQGRG